MKVSQEIFTTVLIQVLLISSLAAQTNPVSVGEEITMKSTVMGETRELLISTPNDYKNSTAKYPVLYLLDAEWNFHYVTGLVKQLSSIGAIPDMLVVGVVNTNRNRDLTPAGPNDNGGKFGGAENFLKFLGTEVMPLIEKEYRVHPFNILVGHSFGGLFAVYAMMEQPNLFQSYLILSPSLGRNDEQQVARAEKFFENDPIIPKRLFLAIANEGGTTYLSSRKLASIIDHERLGETYWSFEHYQNEDHESVTVPGFRDGLTFIFNGYDAESLPELDEIFLVEDHYRILSEALGYEIGVPEAFYQKFTKEQVGERDLDYALYILKKYQEKFPNSPDMMLLYADTYLLKGDFENARIFYGKLMDLGFENGSIHQIWKRLK